MAFFVEDTDHNGNKSCLEIEPSHFKLIACNTTTEKNINHREVYDTWIKIQVSSYLSRSLYSVRNVLVANCYCVYRNDNFKISCTKHEESMYDMGIWKKNYKETYVFPNQLFV